MPSSVAFLTAGRIASESIARMMSTLAPFEMRLSTSASCLVGEPCASAEIYLAPLASRAPLIAASSVFQRSSWKFDQETPTVTSFADAARDVRLTEANSVAPSASALRIFMSIPPLEVLRGPAKRLLDRILTGRARGIFTLTLNRALAQPCGSVWPMYRVRALPDNINVDLFLLGHDPACVRGFDGEKMTKESGDLPPASARIGRSEPRGR